MRCLNCFKEIEDDVCPHCGTVNGEFKNKLNCLQPGTTLAEGRYVIGKAINAGGFGIVYKAFDTTLEIIVAIKEFFPSALATRVVGKKDIVIIENTRGLSFSESKESFLLEARIMEKLKGNPNIVFGRDWFEENNTAYIVMEFIEGINVRDFMNMNEDNKLDLESTEWIVKQIINALKDIHKQGYIFRDLTPDNIMITTQLDSEGHNIIKLIDFGAAVKVNTNVDTATDDIILKPGYAPIEQYVSGGVLGEYTDVYALGATIYRMLTGLVPYESTDRNNEDILEKITEIDETIPEYIDKTVMKAMAIDKKIRFQTIDDFEKAFIHDQEVLYPEEELRRLKLRKNAFFGLLMCVCVALFGVTFYIQQQRSVGIKNINITADTISIAFPYESEDDKEYLQDIITSYSETNNEITVEVEFIPKSSYESTIKSKSELPTVFFNDNYVDVNRLYELDELFDSINLDQYYFLKENTEKLKYQIPLGFDVAVCYVNINLGDSENPLELTDVNDKVAFNTDYLLSLNDSNIQFATKEQFLNENVAYYVGNLSEWRDVYNKLGGYWTVKPFTNKANIRLGDYVSISNNATDNQKNAAMLLVYELLSDLAQNDRYIQMNGLAPINKDTCDKFVEFHQEMNFIVDQKDEYIYYLDTIDENNRAVENLNK